MIGRATTRGANRWVTILLSGGAGLVAATGQAPLYLWWLALVGWMIAVAQLRRAFTAWRAFYLGWLTGVGYIGGTHFWIIDPFLVDAPRHGWIAPFALAAMVAGIALFFAAAFGLAHRLGRGPQSRMLALIGTLTLTELGRAYLFTGFPWALMGSLWLGQSAMQAAAVVGPFGMVLGTAAVVILPVALVGRLQWLGGAGALLLLAIGTIFGLARLPPGAAPDTGKTVRIVQPNAAQHLKWHPDMIPVFFGTQLELTEEVKPGPPPDLIVWPETSLAYGLYPEDQPMQLMASAADGVPLVFGVQRREGPRWFNSLAVIGVDGALAGTYDKHHLVPFGEYIPFGDMLGAFGITAFASQVGNGYSAGQGAQVLDVAGIGKVLPLICYEAIFPQDVAAASERADVLLQVTNDAWFGTGVMPYQHLDQTRLRAIEQGLPVIRAANTGVSAVIDPYGRVTAELALNTAGALDAPLPRPIAPTIYARTGDWPVIATMLILLALIWGAGRGDHLDPRGPGG